MSKIRELVGYDIETGGYVARYDVLTETGMQPEADPDEDQSQAGNPGDTFDPLEGFHRLGTRRLRMHVP